jgi:ketosteroid isomerase-like protein
VQTANEDLVRECYARVSRREVPYDLIAPDAEILQTSLLPDSARTFHGHEGAAQMLQELWDAFADIRWEEIRMESERDKVVALMRVVGRGHGSGLETETAVVHVWTVRDGRLARMEAPASLDEAYRLAGIER